MTDVTNGGRIGSLARNQYQEGQVLRARDLKRESDYFLARDRQHNALAHGPGILVGLQLVAYKAGTETAVPEEALSGATPQPLDLYVTRGAAIDWLGRLVIVPKRVPVRVDLAAKPSPLDAGMYRLELVYRSEAPNAGERNGSSCEEKLPGVVEEGYQIRLGVYDPNEKPPQLDEEAVLESRIDESVVLAPIDLGVVTWSGQAYTGYSTLTRVYASVRAHRVRGPDDRAEVELRDDNDRFAVRFADMPPAGATDPFTPGQLQDRFRIDSNGTVWVPAEVGVGPEGVRFRSDSDPAAPEASNWRVLTAVRTPGADFGMNDATPAPVELKGEEYTSGPRELQILFQREGSNLGRHRVVIGHVNELGGDFKPALVVYDRPPRAGGTGSATVEVWGDLYVRGTAFMYAAARRAPTSGPVPDELDLLLRQLAGPFAGAFRLFLTNDPTWLAEFAGIMATQVAQTAAVRTAFVNAIVSDTNFINAVTNAVVPQAVSQAVTAVQSAANLPGLVAALLANAQFTTGVSAAAVAAVQNAANLPGLISAIADELDDQAASSANLPSDLTRRLVAAIYRRLLTDPTGAHAAIKASVSQDPSTLNKIDEALYWLTV